MESLNGTFASSIPISIKLVLLTVILVAVLLFIFWVIRFFSPKPVALPAPDTMPVNARPPRLAITDAAVIDHRRRLVLVRRDDVEHLVMIGGASDVLIEKNIKGMVAPLTRTAQMAQSTEANQAKQNIKPTEPTRQSMAQNAPQPAGQPVTQPVGKSTRQTTGKTSSQKEPHKASTETTPMTTAGQAKTDTLSTAAQDSSIGEKPASILSTSPATSPGEISPATLSKLEKALGVELTGSPSVMRGQTASPLWASSPQEQSAESNSPARPMDQTTPEKSDEDQQMQNLLNELTGEKI